jgi:hypothetical protein
VTASNEAVTPLKNGVQIFCNSMKVLDSGFHRNDGEWAFGTFCEGFEFVNMKIYLKGWRMSLWQKES